MRFLRIFIRIGIFMLLTAVLAGAYIYYLANPIPGQEDLTNLNQAQTTTVLDGRGRVMGSFFSQDRYSVALSAISPFAIDALIATEDHRFYSHNGVDYWSLARVVWKSLIMRDNAGGGSTITQQLAKNLAGRKKVQWLYYPVNKTREMVMASRLESYYSKDEILELYLNTVSFGNRIYGIESASRAFFDKNAFNLSAAEAATLIGMLKANTTYHPGLHPEQSVQRRNLVLSLMYEHEMINQFQLLEGERSALQVSDNWRKDERSYLLTRVKNEATELIEAYNGKEGTNLHMNSSGLKIYTSIDYGLQKAATMSLVDHMESLQKKFDAQWPAGFWEEHDDLLQSELSKIAHGRTIQELSKPKQMTIYGSKDQQSKVLSPMDSLKHYLQQLQAGFVAIDPKSGGILAWVGGTNFQLFPYDHVDYQAKRQVGSIFKPIVYASALEAGIDPCTYYAAEQVAYEVEEGEWNPRNSDGSYDGSFTMEDALEGSVNTISVKILESVGIDRTIQTAERMGVQSDIPEVLSIAVGTPSISLLEMATAYAVFANEGFRIDPFLISRIEDSHGKVIYARKDQKKTRVLSKNTSLEMTHFLKGVVDEGTARSLRTKYGISNDIGGKTGTTQANADGWFMSISPNMVTGSWVGGIYPAIAFTDTRVGQGATMALPIVGKYYQAINKEDVFNRYTKATFASLPAEVAHAIDCLPLEEDNFFQRLFGKKNRKQTALDKEDQEEKKGFFKKVTSIFKKKDKKQK